MLTKLLHPNVMEPSANRWHVVGEKRHKSGNLDLLFFLILLLIVLLKGKKLDHEYKWQT